MLKLYILNYYYSASSNGSYVIIQSEHIAYRQHISFSLTVKGGAVDAMTKLGNRVFWLDRTDKMKVFTPGEILNGKYLVERVTINNDNIVNTTSKLIAVFPGSDYIAEFLKSYELHPCSEMMNKCAHICIPFALDTGGGCYCEYGYETVFDRVTKCVKSNSSETSIDSPKKILEAQDFVGEEIKCGGSGNSLV